MYVCMYVCMNVRVHVRMYRCVCLCVLTSKIHNMAEHSFIPYHQNTENCREGKRLSSAVRVSDSSSCLTCGASGGQI